MKTLNDQIRSLGSEKVEILKEIRDFRKGIVILQWENTRADMEVDSRPHLCSRVHAWTRARPTLAVVVCPSFPARARDIMTRDTYPIMTRDTYPKLPSCPIPSSLAPPPPGLTHQPRQMPPDLPPDLPPDAPRLPPDLPPDDPQAVDLVERTKEFQLLRVTKDLQLKISGGSEENQHVSEAGSAWAVTGIGMGRHPPLNRLRRVDCADPPTVG